jgi:cytochrome c biogenesis protein CcmG/thiol:disulfide interchange protein DsbE
MNKWGFIAIAAIFGVIGGVFLKQIIDPSNDKLGKTPLLNKLLPTFNLENLYDKKEPLTQEDTKKNRLSLINFWASWCIPCREEHPVLTQIAKDYNIPIYGINYKDDQKKAQDFIKRHGNPYQKIGRDHTGRTGIDFGVYGIPETYFIDEKGTIIYKHIGPINKNDLTGKLKPFLEKSK